MKDELIKKYQSELSGASIDRAREMNKYYKAGYAYSEIAEEFGISRQRVYQVLKKYWEKYGTKTP